MKILIAFTLLFLVAGPLVAKPTHIRSSLAARSSINKPVGSWRLFHSDGKPLMVYVKDDGTCYSDWEEQQGTWSSKDGQLLLTWSDGWQDLITENQGLLRKQGFAPKVPLTGKPANMTEAYKLDTQQ
jgi:hypothetical protein